MLLGALAFLFLIVSVGLCYWWQRQAYRKRVREYFAGRVPLDDEEFYQAFYRDSGIPRRIPIIVRRLVAVGLWLPEEKLHPDDDLVALGDPFVLDNLDIAELFDELRKELAIPITDDDALGCVLTLRSLTAMCARVARGNNTAGGDPVPLG